MAHDGDHFTCTMLSVCAVTGSEKSPPGGLTAPTILREQNITTVSDRHIHITHIHTHMHRYTHIDAHMHEYRHTPTHTGRTELQDSQGSLPT